VTFKNSGLDKVMESINLDTVSRIHTFQACSFNHSDKSPEGLQK